MNSYTISWDGKLLGCQILGKFYTECMSNGFKHAWSEYPFVVKLPPKNEKCSNCKCLDYCSTCYAMNYAETGELNKCSSYIYGMANELKKIILE